VSLELKSATAGDGLLLGRGSPYRLMSKMQFSFASGTGYIQMEIPADWNKKITHKIKP
jgi:hypothetical protein